MRRVASTPLTPGMRRSIRITSGGSDAARSIGSSPLHASPTISIVSSSASRLRRPLRVIVWSSAIGMRIGSMLIVPPPGLYRGWSDYRHPPLRTSIHNQYRVPEGGEQGRHSPMDRENAWGKYLPGCKIVAQCNSSAHVPIRLSHPCVTRGMSHVCGTGGVDKTRSAWSTAYPWAARRAWNGPAGMKPARPQMERRSPQINGPVTLPHNETGETGES
jgi:hypothetical protein